MRWQDTDLKPLFAGVDEEFQIFALYRRMMGSPKRNAVQTTFYLAWEATELINSDGFEKLVEQAPTLEEYSLAFEKLGMPEVCTVFQKVIALVPADFRKRSEDNQPLNVETLFEHVRGYSDELRQRMNEFFEASERVVEVLGRYVRQHREHFIPYAEAKA